MKRALNVALAALLLGGMPLAAPAYVINHQIADTDDPRNAGVSACPLPTRIATGQTQGLDRRWDTTLGPNILTSASFPGGSQAEVQSAILDSYFAWTGVDGSAITSASYAPLAAGNDCAAGDGLNTICFSQDDSFAPGVLAFTRVTTATAIGQTAGTKTAAFVGQILDADVELNPAIPFATPGALAANPSAYDLESILIHELGHALGFAESPLPGATMFPFAPDLGTFRNGRTSPASPDAPLADDDRAGLRALYPGGSAYGAIRGRVLPASPLSLAALPATAPGMPVTGYYGTHVVAVDAETGQVVAGALGGWSCDPTAQKTSFDGSYEIAGLPLGHSYLVYVEPLTGPVSPPMLSGPLAAQPCRPQSANNCTPPPPNTLFSPRIRP